MIKAVELSRAYGQLLAVDRASFQIERGEIVGLLGHNGAGKTTIMKMLTGYIEPTSGTATIDGLDIKSDRARIQERIGYLPENCPLYTDMYVLDFLRYAASLKGLSGAGEIDAIRTAVGKTRLHAVARQPVSTLSRGYRQRLGVAQAILASPRILILDEPTNGLDPSQIQEMRGLIKELARKATVIISTHILQEVQAICDRVIIINNGQVALDSSMQDLGSSNRLSCTMNSDATGAREMLEKLDGVVAVVKHSNNGSSQFQIEIDEASDVAEMAATVAKAVVDSGFNLYSLQKETRDLEVIFGEISRGRLGEANLGQETGKKEPLLEDNQKEDDCKPQQDGNGSVDESSKDDDKEDEQQ